MSASLAEPERHHRSNPKLLPLESLHLWFERFLENVPMQGEDACWPWQGTIQENGYGTFSLDCSLFKAHRIMVAVVEGLVDIPDGVEPDHTCRNRACVNPNHLELVTFGENIRRGLRARSGEEN